MAVAEKTKSSEKKAPAAGAVLVPASVVEGLLIFAVLALMCAVIPRYWLEYASGIFQNDYLSISLLLLTVALVGIAGMIMVAVMEGPKPIKGIRAGGIFMALGFIIAANVFLALVGVLVSQFESIPMAFGGSAIVGLVIVGVFFLMLNQPGVQRFLIGLEDNGLFHARGFKYNQGMKVRRATLVALLAVIGFGLSWASQSRFFSAGDWYYTLYGNQDESTIVVVLYQTLYSVPFIIAVLLAWFAWRVINYPVFADFLIATEAEMNKVSWTTRKRLIQDTIVVLVTVFLFTAFLFIVDILWVKILSFPVPGVLQVDPQQVKEQLLAPKEW